MSERHNTPSTATTASSMHGSTNHTFFRSHSSVTSSTSSGSTLSTASLTRGSTTGSISSSSITSSSSTLTSGISKPPSSLLSHGRGLSTSTSSSSSTSQGSSENLPPRTLARVARDVRDLVKNPPEGVRLVLDGETGMPGSLSEVLAEIEGPEQTPYHTRYFQLKLCLSTDFPSTPPRGYFLTKIYHPNVDPTTGAICVNTLKKDWTPTTSLSHVLTVIRCLLIVPFPESSLNDEAGKNFMESYDEYARRAKLLAGVHGLKCWSSGLYNNNTNDGSGGKSDSMDVEGGKDVDNGPTSSNLLCSSSSSANNENVKSGNKGSRSNIVRANSKVLDKKSKKKSLKRL